MSLNPNATPAQAKEPKPTLKVISWDSAEYATAMKTVAGEPKTARHATVAHAKTGAPVKIEVVGSAAQWNSYDPDFVEAFRLADGRWGFQPALVSGLDGSAVGLD